MKIALLNDFKKYAGAENSIKQRLKQTPKHIKCDFITPNDKIDYDLYDGFVLENIVKFSTKVLHEITESRPYIKVEHDFNFCVYRNQIQCKVCEYPCPIQINPFMKELYTNAKMVICASPAHMGLQKQLLKDWDVNFKYGLPWAFSDVKVPKVNRKKKTVAFLGTMRKYKGIYDIVNLATRKPDYQFDLAGRHGFLKGNLPDNVKYLGEIDDKWKYLAEHEYFIHVPQHLDPCPGTVIEAILAGCKVIFNANVGTLSYPFKTKADWEHALEKSAPMFWSRVTDTFKNDKND